MRSLLRMLSLVAFPCSSGWPILMNLWATLIKLSGPLRKKDMELGRNHDREIRGQLEEGNGKWIWSYFLEHLYELLQSEEKNFKIYVFREAQRFLETEHCKRVNFSFIPNVGVLQILGVDKERGIQGLLFQSVIIDGRLYHLHLKQDKQSRRGLRWDIVGQASPPLWWFEWKWLS